MSDKRTRRGSRGKGQNEKYSERVLSAEEGVVVKVLEFGGDAVPSRGDSKQLTPDLFESVIQEGEVIRPLYDPLLWAMLLEQNVRLHRCVSAMALNTVGLGVELAAMADSKEFVEENKANIKAERLKLGPLFRYPNGNYSFEEMMQWIKTDEECEGQGYMEVSRDGKGEIDGFYHAPGHTIRVLARGKGFLQMRTGIGAESFLFSPGKTAKDSVEKVYFKNFGDKRLMDKNTGEFKGLVSIKDRANELIVFKLYSPRSSFYGVPRFVAAAPAIAGNRLAQLRNCSFFENDAVPRLAIIVSGGNLDGGSIKMIENFIEAKGKGPMNFGRVMVLQPEQREAIPGSEVGKASIQLIPLTVGVTEDASFTRYLVLNDETIRESFGIGNIFLGTVTDINRASAFTSKQVTMEQIFEPEIKRYEYRLNVTVMRDLAAKYTRLRFVRPKVVDLSQEALAYASLAAAGGVSPNDIRDLLGYDPFTAEWANTPVPLIKMGYFEGDSPQQEPMVSPADQEEERPGSLVDSDLARVKRIYGESTGYSGNLQLIADGNSHNILAKLRASIEK